MATEKYDETLQELAEADSFYELRLVEEKFELMDKLQGQ